MDKMKRQKNEGASVTLQEIFYYLFFALLFFAKGIGLYDGQNQFKIFLLLAMLCLGVKLILTEYKVKELALIGILTMAAMLSYLNTREKGILFTLMIVIGLKNIPIKRMFKVALLVWSISFLPVVILTTLNWMESPFRVHVRPAIGFVIRWGLGSAHPNVGHIAYLVFMVLVVYVLGEKISLKWCAALFAGNCFVYLYTMSQTGLLVTTFYLLATIYLMYRKNPSRLEYGLVECVLPACMVASLVLPLVLKGKAFDILNKLMNTRVMQAKRYLTEEEITLFGSGMQLNDEITTMDNSFVFAFMTYGVITFAIIMAGYFLLIRKCVKEQKKGELALIVTLLIAGLSEPFLFNTSFKNISLLFMGELLFGSVKTEGIWNLEVRLLSGWNKTIGLPTESLDKAVAGMKACVSERKVLCALGAVIVALIWGTVYGMATDVPEKITVPRSLCDSVEQESVYLASNTAGQDEVVLGYVDEETPMVSFTGMLPNFEYIRGIVCRVVYGAGLGFGVVLVGYYMIKYRDSSN